VGISLGAVTLYAPFAGEVGCIGRSASFSVRPERLRIQPRGVVREPKRNVYDATVQEHDYLGAVVRYYLRLGDGLIVKADEHNVSGVRYRPGEEVTVEIPPDDCFVLPVAD
jgi:ABC-type Fe3+/spermidine/putrescine transport system ATPase subunit